MTRRRVFVALGTLVIGGFALSACGIPMQRTASPISESRPQTALPPAPPPVSPCAARGCVKVDVYFEAPTGRLRAVSRYVPRDAKPTTALTTVVRTLLAGPTTPEVEDTGITTALGGGIQLHSASVTTKKKLVRLTLNASFGTLSGALEVLGVAQLVYTVNAVIPGAGVTFESAGATTFVPVETGALAPTPVVHESQYASLRTPTVPTATTAP